MRIVHNGAELDTGMLVTIIHAGIMRNLHSVNLHYRSSRNEVDSHCTGLGHSLCRKCTVSNSHKRHITRIRQLVKRIVRHLDTCKGVLHIRTTESPG